MPSTYYQIQDQAKPFYLTFQVVCCLGLFIKTRHGQQLQRIIQQYSQGQNTIEKVWTSACEYITENDQTTTLTYLSGPEGVFALHVKNPNGTENMRYIHKDHLGSWHTITDESGNLLQELSFDAWGNRRNPATWRAFTGTPPEPLFDRGFTGHEHLNEFQLINMNGRMYDPVVSRMLSPDNFIQAPDFSQSFNRYSYVWNNPLVLTDPSGEWVEYAIYAAFLYLNTAYANRDEESGRWAWNPLDWFEEGKPGFEVGINYDPNSNGFTYHGSVWYSNDKWTGSIGGSYNSSELGAWIESKNADGYGVRFYRTYYGNTIGPDDKYNRQIVGGFKISSPKASFRIENDFFGDGFDRWRTNAWELEFNMSNGHSILIGSYIYTNSPVLDEDILPIDDFYRSEFWNRNFRAYADGRVFNSPFYVGWRNDNKTFRYGWDHPVFQDIQQNGLHILIDSPLFYTPYDIPKRTYFYSGYYNPISLFY